MFEGPPDTLNKYRGFFNAAVSRPVSRAEMLKNPKARALTRNEWLGLQRTNGWDYKQDVFDFSVIREYFDVKQEAVALKQVVHFARVHGVVVEKNYQLPESVMKEENSG